MTVQYMESIHQGLNRIFFPWEGEGDVNACKRVHAHVSAPTRFFKLNFGISKDKNH